MNEHDLPDLLQQNSQELNAQLQALQLELDTILQKTAAFEAILQANLADEIIQEIELSALYKTQKKAKQEKRKAQKLKGKNSKPSTSLVTNQVKRVDALNIDDEKERKRLYREALLHVHPDKFTMNDVDSDIAHSTTSQLIEIYNSGDLSMLQAFHAHIFSGQVFAELKQTSLIKSETVSPNTFLKKKIENLSATILQAKNRITFQVLETYANPLDFILELKVFYRDRIDKLKKRTRTK
jgi:hypothetical protein